MHAVCLFDSNGGVIVRAEVSGSRPYLIHYTELKSGIALDVFLQPRVPVAALAGVTDVLHANTVFIE